MIIPDIHHKWKIAQDIIDKEKTDRIICLGDLQDDFGDTPAMVTDSCRWFLKFIENPNNIFITGNHELSYMFPCYRCSGYTQLKQSIIDNLITPSDWKKCHYYYNLDNVFLLSHAGIHNRLLLRETSDAFSNEYPNAYKKLLNDLNNLSNYAVEQALDGKENNLFGPGKSRGGWYRVGGIMWCDGKEFEPTIGLNQIFGHTPNSVPMKYEIPLDKAGHYTYNIFGTVSKEYITTKVKSFNVNLDTHLNSYAIWNGSELIVKPI